jgi:hypothetical protein
MAGFQVLIEYPRCSEHAIWLQSRMLLQALLAPRRAAWHASILLNASALPTAWPRMAMPCIQSCSRGTIASASSPVGRYWTYGTADPWKGTCWLKHSMVVKENQANRLSGWIPTDAPVLPPAGAPGPPGAAGAFRPPNPRDANETHTLAPAVATTGPRQNRRADELTPRGGFPRHSVGLS